LGGSPWVAVYLRLGEELADKLVLELSNLDE
jgi:hypothetical protein